MNKQYTIEKTGNTSWMTLYPQNYTKTDLEEERQYLTDSGWTRQPTTEYEIWTKTE